MWNRLPKTVVQAPNMNTFRNQLDVSSILGSLVILSLVLCIAFLFMFRSISPLLVTQQSTGQTLVFPLRWVK